MVIWTFECQRIWVLDSMVHCILRGNSMSIIVLIDQCDQRANVWVMWRGEWGRRMSWGGRNISSLLRYSFFLIKKVLFLGQSIDRSTEIDTRCTHFIHQIQRYSLGQAEWSVDQGNIICLHWIKYNGQMSEVSKSDLSTIQQLKTQILGDSNDLRKKKRKGRSGPNPLSCKKKKKMKGDNGDESMDNERKKKKSRRRKKSKIATD